jgi:hypothetical protein
MFWSGSLKERGLVQDEEVEGTETPKGILEVWGLDSDGLA